ncbi:MAG: GNAT family N-acetyltransferase [Patescibacteria group bacterium]
MENDILIRKADIRDLKDILRLNFDLFKKEHKEYDESLNLEWTYDEGKKYFKNRIVKESGFAEVAEAKGRIIGYLCGGISDKLVYRNTAKYAELENMLVEENFRGVGIGARLTENFINWCKENKVDYISVTASAENKQTVDFYRKLGFKDYTLTLEMKTKK